MSTVWESSDVQVWLSSCREQHTEYYKLLGKYEWMLHKATEHKYLKMKIAYALFGPCMSPSKKQQRDINKMFELIQESKKCHRNKQDIWASFLYVNCKAGDNCFQVPVIRVPECDVMPDHPNSDIFIDSSFRVYRSWQDFLDNNRLPDCLMCYPHNGRYLMAYGELQLGQQVSPEGRTGAKVLKGVDITTTVAQVASVGFGVTALFVPIAWPVLIGELCYTSFSPAIWKS